MSEVDPGIYSFTGRYAVFSNFYTGCDVLVECRFQAAKTLDPKKRARILTASSPREAKELGRVVSLRSDWEKIKLFVMYDLISEKFRVGSYPAKALLFTADLQLVEGNRWHDNYWGDCLCEGCRAIDGKNWLGIILMHQRARLRGDKNGPRQSLF